MSGAAAGWLGLTGSAFQQRAQVETDKQVANARLAEMQKQQEYAQKAGELVKGLAKQSGSEAAKVTMAEGQKKREQAFGNVQKTNLFAGNNVRMNEADNLRTQGLAKNRAVLGSYGDWSLRDLINKIQVQNELNKLTGQAEGHQNIVAPYLENEAAHRYDAWQMAGSALMMAGNTVGSYYSNPSTSGNRAPTYVAPADSGPWTSGQNEHYLQYDNVG